LLVGALAGAVGGAIWAGLIHLLDYKKASPEANRVEVGAPSSSSTAAAGT